jgi:hypothetical protein
MHKRTYQIIENLGYDDKVLGQVKKKTKVTRKTLAYLKGLGLPELALKQIKFLEGYPAKKLLDKSNKELIETLVKKCRRSLDAFANKKIAAKIVFKDHEWTIYSASYPKTIEKLHTVCKPYFDEWSEASIEVTFVFDGSNSWKIVTKKESDLPGS